MFPEKLLHFAWKFGVFEQRNLRLAGGEELTVLSPGRENRDAGPDFQQARLQIDKTKWAGNVEIHVRSSDWYRHRHQDDPAYGNVILHVVHTHDEAVLDRNGVEVPVLELKPLLPPDLENRWLQLSTRKQTIPCAGIAVPNLLKLRSWLDRLVVERLETKTGRISQVLQLTKNDWQEAFYIFLSRSFGAGINAVPFELLARSLPLRVLLKHHRSRFQTEALLFGQSGLLPEEPVEEYPMQLQEEYRFLRRKYGLQPLQGHIWKFLRLRPVNFPTIRIAQLAALFETIPDLLSLVRAATSPDAVRRLFETVATGYWDHHYRFGQVSGFRKKGLGPDTIESVLINTVVPFLFVYGRSKGDERLTDTSLELLYSLKPEKNAVVASWEKLGVKPDSAGDTQALIELRTSYCDALRCMECAVGLQVLRGCE